MLWLPIGFVLGVTFCFGLLKAYGLFERLKDLEDSIKILERRTSEITADTHEWHF